MRTFTGVMDPWLTVPQYHPTSPSTEIWCSVNHGTQGKQHFEQSQNTHQIASPHKYLEKEWFWPRVRLRETDNKQKVLCITFLPCVQNLYNCVSLILAYNNIKTIHLPLSRTCSVLRSVKDSLGLKASGVYKTLCRCGAIFIGETGCMNH
jgi:hypothetical protein